MQQSNYNRTGGLKYGEINRLNYLKDEMIRVNGMLWMCEQNPCCSDVEHAEAANAAHEKTQEFIDYLRQINDRYLSYPNDNIYANGLREYIINEMYSYETNNYDHGLSAAVFSRAVTESGCGFLIDALKDVDRRIKTAM